MSKTKYAVIRCPLSTNNEWIVAIHDSHGEASNDVEYRREHPSHFMEESENEYYVAELDNDAGWTIGMKLQDKPKG